MSLEAPVQAPAPLDASAQTPSSSGDPPVAGGPVARRLCLLGGESAGKTTLARALAHALGAPFVPEYGRELWLRVGGTFGQPLLLEVAREQVRREEQALALARAQAAQRGAAQAWVVCDTSALTTLVYCLLDHADAPEELHALARRPYDLTVLCALDFAFVQDGARRDAVFSARQQALTVQLLREFGMRWVAASGEVQTRLGVVQAALAALGTGAAAGAALRASLRQA